MDINVVLCSAAEKLCSEEAEKQFCGMASGHNARAFVPWLSNLSIETRIVVFACAER
jgi:hypothetical protein